MENDIETLRKYLNPVLDSFRDRETQYLSLKDKGANALVRLILSPYFKSYFSGVENLSFLSEDKAQVLAINHVSIFDPFISIPNVMRYSGHVVCGFTKLEGFTEEGWKGPFYRFALGLGSAFAIDRKNGNATMKPTIKLMRKQKAWVALAPEGTVSLDGSLWDFEAPGITGLYRTGRAEFITPIHITYDFAPKGLWRRAAFINIGEPFEPTSKDEEVIVDELRERMVPLATLTIDHLMAVYLGQLNNNKITSFYSIHEHMQDLVYRTLEYKYNLDQRLDTESIKSHVSSTRKWFEKKDILDGNDIIPGSIGVSLEKYLDNPKLNEVRSIQIQENERKSILEEKIKQVGRKYIKRFPADYLRYNAPDGIEEIVETYLSTRYSIKSEANPV